MRRTTRLNGLALVALVGCQASNVELDSDGDLVVESPEDSDGGDDDVDSGQTDEPSNEDDAGTDESAGRVEYAGDVEIFFVGETGLFCSGAVYFYVESEQIDGEGDCELQAGLGAGTSIALFFDGESSNGELEGVVYSDWETPEGDGLAESEFQAELRANMLTVEWETQVPIPGDGGWARVEGRAEASR